MPLPRQMFRLWAAALPMVATAQERAAPPALGPELAAIAAAYAAKVVASARFVCDRSLDSVLAEEFAPDRPLELLIRPLLQFDIDETTRTVTCRLGGARATAVATADFGCTLLEKGADAEPLRNRRAPGLPDLQPDPASQPWPLGDRRSPVPAEVDQPALATALDAAFAEPRSGPRRRTRAVVVVYRGQLLAERYAPGYRADQRLPGWSMTKSWCNALVGLRVMDGALDLTAPLPVPEWPAGDPRRAIGWSHLLAMTTGLAWREDYADPTSDALQMLFGSHDHAARAAAARLQAPPGTTWAYSSGTTNLLCRAWRATFANDLEHLAYPRTRLFQPLGMRSAVLETDPGGTFVGSSYGFATARDWARFGLLYAGRGTVAGKTILPASWCEESGTPAPGSRGRFGRHLWCNADPDGAGEAARPWPELPADLQHCDGHEGQYVVAIPSRDLVVVRLGCTKTGSFDIRGLVRGVLAALPKPPAESPR